MDSVVEEGRNALARLPDDITAPELDRRVTHLREQVTEFESVAEHLAAPSASASADAPAVSDTEAASAPVEEPGDTTDTGATVTDEPQPPESGKPDPSDAEESNSVVRTADGVEETAQHPAPVVLQVREQLTEDGRRHVFRAETVDGDAVQLDVWNRHVSAFEWEPDAWYTFENVRGQRWTVNGESGVMVSTTPDAIVTQHDSFPDANVTTG